MKILALTILLIVLIGVSSTKAVAAPSYTSYVALLTQIDSEDPTAVVLENSLGVDLTWVRLDTGVYQAVTHGAFQTGAFIPNPHIIEAEDPYTSVTISTDGDAIYISTVDISTWGSRFNTDNRLRATPIEIRVYQ